MQPLLRRNFPMKSQKNYFHTIIGRKSLITILTITLISITAAGSNAAGFSFLDPVKEFFGIAPIKTSSLLSTRDVPNRDLTAAPSASDPRAAKSSNVARVPRWIAGQAFDANNILNSRILENLFAGKALQFNGTNQYVTFGAAPSLGVTTSRLRHG